MTDSAYPDLPPAQRPRRPNLLLRHLRAVSALMLREMATRYGRSPGGYAWALLEPMGMIVVLAFGFSLLLRSPALGSSFLLFYATGYLPFGLCLSNARMVMNALSFSRSLLRYPAVSWFDAIMARVVLNVLTSMLVSYVLLMGILIGVGHQSGLELVPILGGFAEAGLLGMGLGLVNCVIVGFFPVWANIWGILTRPLFLGSGIFWLLNDLPQTAQDILWWNPLVHVVAYGRTGYYATYDPQYVSHVYVMGISLSLIAFGFLLLRRFHLEILERR